jgi:small nuclear ribonucleoprotein (snRNP)-like protein
MTTTETTQPPKDRTVSFNQYLDKECFVVFNQHHEIKGVIKGWDSLNLIIADATEYRSIQNNCQSKELVRILGEVLVRIQTIESIFPSQGYEKIEKLTISPAKGKAE